MVGCPPPAARTRLDPAPAILGGESTIKLADLEGDGAMDVIATDQGTFDWLIFPPHPARRHAAAPFLPG